MTVRHLHRLRRSAWLTWRNSAAESVGAGRLDITGDIVNSGHSRDTAGSALCARLGYAVATVPRAVVDLTVVSRRSLAQTTSVYASVSRAEPAATEWHSLGSDRFAPIARCWVVTVDVPGVMLLCRRSATVKVNQ